MFCGEKIVFEYVQKKTIETKEYIICLKIPVFMRCALILALCIIYRYVRITEELQRVDLEELSREESLAFFINLYNMMAIHAILSWGPPTKAMERRRFFGDFKYVIGGFPYSLSAIHNGILRSNQRPPYSLTKPFAPRDKRLKVTLFPFITLYSAVLYERAKVSFFNFIISCNFKIFIMPLIHY
jgi:Protein of unknown function, DUF547